MAPETFLATAHSKKCCYESGLCGKIGKALREATRKQGQFATECVSLAVCLRLMSLYWIYVGHAYFIVDYSTHV